MERILVADIMTRDPVIINPDTNLLDCAKKMVNKGVGSLLLVDKKRLVGFISEKDILWALIKKSKSDLSVIKAIDISPKKLATIKPFAPIKEALDKMKKLKFERLPVIHEGKLVGIITIKDILNFKPEIYPELDELAQIREEANKLRRLKKVKERKMGLCEGCGNYDVLTSDQGTLLCESCRDEI
ncbi:CBS domain-containing protein [Candidatus Pacearchaeota archaeon]|nr:CBS domain-containing protein [Candidatus Pacearchaeota archaeon]